MKSRIIQLLLSSLILTGCATPQVQVTAFTDPDFVNKSYRQLVVAAPNLLPENAVYFEQEMCRALAAAVERCEGASAMFPPTRAYSSDQVIGILKASGADAVLAVHLLSDDSTERYVGTYATVNPYGTAFAVPIVKASRGARATVELLDIDAWRSAWAGQVVVTGQGHSSTDKALISAGAKEIGSELVSSGHVTNNRQQ